MWLASALTSAFRLRRTALTVGAQVLPNRVARIGIEPLWQEREHWKAQFWDLRERLLETPAATPRGILAKLRGFFHDGEIADMRAGDDPDDDLPKEFAASVYRDLERLIGEAPSLAPIRCLPCGASGLAPTQ